ncbi:MAG TPA: hypothetical protein VGN86_13935 [Pyrinomonadaceae bacterium]|nr:hypothetical protein [Pyrinomonadaceae bacterium]
MARNIDTRRHGITSKAKRLEERAIYRLSNMRVNIRKQTATVSALMLTEVTMMAS